MTEKTSIETALAYHEATKHHPHRYARSPGYLDWATQPDPFRRYAGSECTPLVRDESRSSPSYDEVHEPGAVTPVPVDSATLSEFLRCSLALSAWKALEGARWALRVNPSSGNLHPTEGYLVVGEVEGLLDAAGVFHYAPKEHALERRCEFAASAWTQLAEGFPAGTFFAGLSSIHWREAWKYGERAYRYCQHDVGHALAALSFSAAMQGWRVHPLDQMGDEEIAALLGLDRDSDFDQAEREHPDLLVAIIPAKESSREWPSTLPSETMDAVMNGTWYGRANLLSPDHVEWDRIDTMAEACANPSMKEPEQSALPTTWPKPLRADRPSLRARNVILQRRSAVAMDGSTSISADALHLIMDRLIPRFDRAPWCALQPPAFINLGLFVHRVDGLAPGIYFLDRANNRSMPPRDSMRQEFEWSRPPGCPTSLPLIHLVSGDVRSIAGQLSCGQSIASDGVFSVAMISEFETRIRERGAWMYRRLFWEAGMIGQVLYLEAEAAGVRGTGIGCYFDDPVHELFGLADKKHQSLYHFTVGGPVEDPRLTTLPPYASGPIA